MSTAPETRQYATEDFGMFFGNLSMMLLDPRKEVIDVDRKYRRRWLIGYVTVYYIYYRLIEKPAPPPKPLPKIDFICGPVQDRAFPQPPKISFVVGPVSDRTL